MARRLSRSYKRRRRQRVLFVLGLIVLTVSLTMLLNRCDEEHTAAMRQLDLPQPSGDE